MKVQKEFDDAMIDERKRTQKQGDRMNKYTVQNALLFAHAKRIMMDNDGDPDGCWHMGRTDISRFINWLEQNYELKEIEGGGQWEKLKQSYEEVQIQLKKLKDKEKEMSDIIKLLR